MKQHGVQKDADSKFWWKVGYGGIKLERLAEKFRFYAVARK